MGVGRACPWPRGPATVPLLLSAERDQHRTWISSLGAGVLAQGSTSTACSQSSGAHGGLRGFSAGKTLPGTWRGERNTEEESGSLACGEKQPAQEQTRWAVASQSTALLAPHITPFQPDLFSSQWNLPFVHLAQLNQLYTINEIIFICHSSIYEF